MYIRAFALLLFLAQIVLAQQSKPIVPDPKLTPEDAFEKSLAGIPSDHALERSQSFVIPFFFLTGADEGGPA